MKTFKIDRPVAGIVLLILCLNVSFTSCETEEITDEDNLPSITGYPIVGTNQSTYYDNQTITTAQSVGDDFYGQNANYAGNQPQYMDNGDGTVTDLVTGLMWQNSFDHNGDGSIDYDDKLSYNDILATADTVSTGGYDDWHVPTIKEQYSLIMFSGKDISGYEGTNTEGLIPFINTDYFDYAYGDTDAGERLIDVQCATTNMYVSTEVEEMVFGVNFADGRIKGYGTGLMGADKLFNYLLVRGNETYGINSFVDNNDGTITDNATGLMWMQDDNAAAILWQTALSYAEGYEFAGYSDWRLPDAKELQSIVNYSRSPATTNSAAIDPVFNCTQITNEAGEVDYPWYWSNTTHVNMFEGNEGSWGAYVSFGRCLGNMSGAGGMPPNGIDTPSAIGGTPPSDGMLPPEGEAPGEATNESNWIDVHGAGAQRSDPKAGDPGLFEDGNGPQGDAVRIYNYVRLVRNI